MQGILPRLETAAKTDDGDNRKLVKKNDFVINSRSDRKGSAGVSSLTGSVSLISTVLTPRGIVPEYAHHLLRSQPFQEEYYRFGKGIVADLWSTNYSEMKNIVIPSPSQDEQRAIAKFLDDETAKIDTLIEKQQQLIQLLKEKRQAVISQAVTKGLNPNAKMRDSGVEWLGEVPEHWDVPRISYFARVKNGSTPSRENLSYWDSADIPWITSGALNDVHINSASEFITEKALAECSIEIISRGAVLVGLVGQGRTRGLSAMLNIDATINQNVCAVMPDTSRLMSEFLHFFLQCAYEPLRDFGRGGNQAALNCELVSDLRITLPSLSEQHTIVSYLKKALPKFEIAEQEMSLAQRLLQERRTALISAAVTGKIDVRDWVPPVSDHRSEDAV